MSISGFHLQPPKLELIYVVLRKDGYAGDAAMKRTDAPFVADFMKLR